MWKLNKGKEFLSYVRLERLQQVYHREQNAKAKLRLLAAIRRKKGESIDEIATALEKPRRTIHEWLHRFEQRRLKAAYDKKQPGRPTRLTRSQLKQLRRELMRGPAHVPSNLWTTRHVREHVEKKYHITYQRSNVFRLLHTLGFSVQQPRQQHYKTNKDLQDHFKKKQNAAAPSTAIADGRLRVWTSARSSSRHTSHEDGH